MQDINLLSMNILSDMRNPGLQKSWFCTCIWRNRKLYQDHIINISYINPLFTVCCCKIFMTFLVRMVYIINGDVAMTPSHMTNNSIVIPTSEVNTRFLFNTKCIYNVPQHTIQSNISSFSYRQSSVHFVMLREAVHCWYLSKRRSGHLLMQISVTFTILVILESIASFLNSAKRDDPRKHIIWRNIVILYGLSRGAKIQARIQRDSSYNLFRSKFLRNAYYASGDLFEFL